jgi:tetratricopeptide (TPR) repeat protein
MNFNISYIAIDRMAQKGRHLYKEGKKKVLLSDARKLSDTDLLYNLSSLGINLGREELKEYFENNPSSQQVAEQFYKKYKLKDSNSDACWHAITILWKRWCPDIPHLESLDDKMQEGYSLLHDAKKEDEAIKKWREYWIDAKWMMKRWGVTTIQAFDHQFPQSQCLFNWSQDYDEALHNAALDNKSYDNERLSFCAELVELLDETDLLTIQNVRRSIAECHYNLGRPEITDNLYRQWLTENPNWSWGWIGWADCYSFFKGASAENLLKAESILREALKIGDIEDMDAILDRLLDVCKQMKSEAGITEVAQRIRSLPHAIKQVKQRLNPFANDDGKSRTGRNEPCPCGSGKKFKKCCGKG